MSTRMLIDARHAEETRVTVVKGNRVEEFDYETAGKVQLKGNIYLAKITRVEPSLQAAFVDYGGNRHGFLAFSEIHPDYYQIPVEDRDALLAEEVAANAETSKPDGENGNESAKDGTSDDTATDDDGTKESGGDDDDNGDGDGNDNDNGNGNSDESDEGTDDQYQEELRRRRLKRLRRKYRIQEVIKRNQILLIQVVKEERGTKGAALTTYISVAGRYCVMMPNTTHSGGISRKISNLKDRKRLRNILNDLPIAKGMGCIIRTNGISRTKAEVKRDFDYLLRAWEGIRNRTFESSAPALIYEEGNLIKRTIRDLYDRTIDDVLVEGEAGYNMAKDFMRLLMPSHASRVQHYKDRIPLFHRYQVEDQLDQMFDPTVTLKSGGYLVINPTEALVAIDVNSGRSTKEHNIEETALKTNLEAAQELARQLRLRDLAGLIVIDFIDMEVRGNVRAVERKMKEAVKSDRARIQIGRISAFGLMEISRQRLRPNLVETATEPCRHCEGSGRIRSIGSSALHIIRGIEEECILARAGKLVVSMPKEVAIYLLNQKRATLTEIEQRFGSTIEIVFSSQLVGTNFVIERVGETSGPAAAPTKSSADKQTRRDAKHGPGDSKGKGDQRGGQKAKDTAKAGADPVAPSAETETPDDDQPKKPRRRRRGRRGGRGRRRGGAQANRVEGVEAEAEAQDAGQVSQTVEAEAAEDQASAEGEKPEAAKKPPRQRRPAKKQTDAQAQDQASVDTAKTAEGEPAAGKEDAPAKPKARGSGKKDKPATEKPVEKDQEKPKKAAAKTPSKAKATAKPAADKPAADKDAESKPAKAKKTAAPRKPRATRAKPKEAGDKAKPEAKSAAAEKKGTKKLEAKEAPKKEAPAKKKSGWWSRGIGS